MNQLLKGFLYVTSWILGWILFSSIIDSGFIASQVYEEGSKGQLITFFSGAIVSIAGGASLYSEVFKK